MLLYNDHGLAFFLALPMAPHYPGHGAWPGTTVPVCIKTAQVSLPSKACCCKPGQAIGRAVESWGADKRVVATAPVGCRTQLDGGRSGFVNKDFDLKFMDSPASDPTWAAKTSISDLVEPTGTQGVELLMWAATRGVLTGTVKTVHASHHIPISNTAAGLMLLENAV
ncbi:MAG: hypothetical protein ACRC2B_20050 [Rubrivivax sp.]